MTADTPSATSPYWDGAVAEFVGKLPGKPVSIGTLKAIAASVVGRRLALDLVAAADLRGRLSCDSKGWTVAG
jgi:hypothetical protein